MGTVATTLSKSVFLKKEYQYPRPSSRTKETTYPLPNNTTIYSRECTPEEDDENNAGGLSRGYGLVQTKQIQLK